MFRFPWSGRSPNPPRFTDEQIQAKVYELWKARGYVGSSPDEDRLKAIALLEEAAPTFGKKHRLDVWGHKDDREFALKVRQFHWERIKTIISAFGLGATAIAAIGLFITYRQGEERLVTERFAKAVEQLGSKEITVRIGSVYALERIAKDSPKDHWTVMEVLTAFVRERSPNRQSSPETSKSRSPTGKEPKLPRIPTDVQSALTAISRRDASKETIEQRLDFSKTYLVEADLTRANLQRAILRSSNLKQANLDSANLQKASLKGANLQQAILSGANLQEAIFDSSANLQQAILYGANLHKVNLNGVNLQKAQLSGANLQQVILTRANLQGADLGRANLQGAFLSDASLQRAFLERTELQEAYLIGANLQQAQLYRANLQGAQLNGVNLQHAIITSVNLQHATLANANLQHAILANANLQKAELYKANLQGANLLRANLQGAQLNEANLQGADLARANLQGAILLVTDLRNTKNLTQSQLEGSDSPLLCNVALPPVIKVNPNRDCDRPPQELVKRYPKEFRTLEEAKTTVDAARKQQWK